MLLRKYPEHFVINTRSKGRVTLEFVSLVSLLSWEQVTIFSRVVVIELQVYSLKLVAWNIFHLASFVWIWTLVFHCPFQLLVTRSSAQTVMICTSFRSQISTFSSPFCGCVNLKNQQCLLYKMKLSSKYLNNFFTFYAYSKLAIVTVFLFIFHWAEGLRKQLLYLHEVVVRSAYILPFQIPLMGFHWVYSICCMFIQINTETIEGYIYYL